MNPKLKPRAITSFIEDEFELNHRKKVIHNQEKIIYDKEKVINSQESVPSEPGRSQEGESFTIFMVRMMMMIIAFVIAISLVVLIDSLISNYQARRVPDYAISSAPPDLY